MTIVQYAIAREYGRLHRLKRERTPDEEQVYRLCAEVVARLKRGK